jgi:hypothetical protein
MHLQRIRHQGADSLRHSNLLYHQSDRQVADPSRGRTGMLHTHHIHGAFGVQMLPMYLLIVEVLAVQLKSALTKRLNDGNVPPFQTFRP